MKYAAIMMVLTTLGSLGWEGRFNSAYEAAAQGHIKQAAIELTISLRQALRDHDTDHKEWPPIR